MLWTGGAIERIRSELSVGGLPREGSLHKLVWQYDNLSFRAGYRQLSAKMLVFTQGKARLAALITSAIVLSSLSRPAHSDDAENFFRGHSVSMVIGFGVGGGYDLYGRLLSRFMSKYLPSKPAIIPQNMTGAGSLRAANYLYSIAPKDGSVIGTFSRTLPLAPLLGGADFDSRKFTWLGSIAQDVVVCFTSHASAIKTWRDFLLLPSSLGGEGAGAEPDIYALFMKNVFGAKVKLVSGYRGTSDIFLAIERGELDGACGISWGTIASLHADWIRNKTINVIVQAGLRKHRDLPDIPILTEVITNQEQGQIMKLILTTLAMSRPFAAPPDIPVGRKEALISAFEQATVDPQFKAEGERMNLDVEPVPAAAIDKMLTEAYATPKVVLAKTISAISK
jgi:tripartite-type tricarboxylate transporter receptor subunit TctC